jgi:hypothetical protein
VPLLVLGLIAVGGSSGCRCSSEGPAPREAPAAAIPTPPCVRGSVQLTFAPSGADGQPAQAPLDPDLELPFASEPGMALALGADFFATGLRHESRGAVALVGRLGADGSVPRLVELGRVRGDVLPPRLASDGTDLWVVLQEGTPSGRELRVSRLAGANLDVAPSWRPGPAQTSAESSAFDVAARAGSALLVYDDWAAVDNHGQIFAAVVRSEDSPEARIEGHPVSAALVDAEAPRVTVRPGGYWLAWLVNARSAGTGRVYDPGDEVKENARAGSAYGSRWLSIVALDTSGKAIGEVRRLTGRQERVVGYDLTAGPSGSAWLTWRQDAPTPGSSGGRIFTAEVRSDGSKDVLPVREDDVGAGEPTWLFAGSDAAPWLTFPDARDRTVLLRAVAPGRLGTPLHPGPELEGAGALAAAGERVLFAVPHGRAIELVPATCSVPLSAGSAPWDGGLGSPSLAPPLDAGAAVQTPARD